MNKMKFGHFQQANEHRERLAAEQARREVQEKLLSHHDGDG